MPTRDSRQIHYRFFLSNGECLQFDLELSTPGLTLANHRQDDLPAWTALDHEKCPHCPLNAASSPRCPLAANLVEVVDTFKDGVATDEVEIVIRTHNRSYGHRAPLAQGLSSMIGLIMVTSGCPYLDRLRPMAHTHLPFASKQETIARAISTYLLAQFFVNRRGGQPDWQLRNLVRIYDDINVVNEHISRRLSQVTTRDASLNALTKLDCFASITAISVESDSLEEIEEMFTAYFQTDSAANSSSVSAEDV